MAQEMHILIVAAAADQRQAKSLKARLEKYRLPANLLGSASGPAKLHRTIESVDISFDINIEDPQGIKALKYHRMIVLCSPNAVASAEVDRWIRTYLVGHGFSRLLCLIIDGEPNASDRPQCDLPEAFPESVRFCVDSKGNLTNERNEPVAADQRPQGDGPSNAFLKLIAGVFSVRYADLKDRQTKRRRRRVLIVAAFIGLVGLYGAFLLWQQHQHQQKVVQQQFLTTVNEAFSALNRKEWEKADKTYDLAQNLLDKGASGSRLMDYLLFRRNHTIPSVHSPNGNEPVDFLISNRAQTLVSGIAYKDQDPVAWVKANGTLKQISIGPSIPPSLQGKESPELLSIQATDDAFWFIWRWFDRWQMSKIDLSTGKRFDYPEKRTSLRLFDGGLRLYLDPRGGMDQGWIAFWQENQLVIEFLPEQKKYQIPSAPGFELDEFKSSQYRSIHFSRERKQALISYGDKRDFYLWDLEKNHLKQANFNEDNMELTSFFTDEHTRYVVANYEAKKEGQPDMAKLIDLETGRVDRYRGIKLYGVVDPARGIFRGSNINSNLLFRLRQYKDQPDWIHVQQKWYGGIRTQSGALYKLTRAGNVVKISYKTGAILSTVPTRCARNPLFQEDGLLHCLDKENKWLAYDLEPFSKQPDRSINIKGLTRIVPAHDEGLAFLANRSSTAQFGILRWENEKWQFEQQATFENQCVDALDQMREDLWFVESFSGNWVAGMCLQRSGGKRVRIKFKGDTASTQPVANPITSLFPLFGPLGDPFIGLQQPKTVEWAPNGYVISEGLKEKLKLPEDVVLLDISMDEASSEAIVNLLKQDKESLIQSLWLWDTNQARPKKELAQLSCPAGSTFGDILKHGFSPDGQWVCWTKTTPSAQGAHIHWQNRQGKSVPQGLPREIKDPLSWLRFSASGRYFLVVSLKNCSVSVYELENGKNIWVGSFREGFELHQNAHYLRSGSNVYDLDHPEEPVLFNYPEKVSMNRFHPILPWVAGKCGNHICIGDLESRQVVFLDIDESDARHIMFSSDNDALLYTLGGQQVVYRKLDLKRFLRSNSD